MEVGDADGNVGGACSAIRRGGGTTVAAVFPLLPFLLVLSRSPSGGKARGEAGGEGGDQVQDVVHGMHCLYQSVRGDMVQLKGCGGTLGDILCVEWFISE